jgi:type I restriction-modification system DNA methylase subunit
MTIKEFYSEFEFTELQNLQQKNRSVDLDEISYLGVDKVYFSGDFPAILFKEVNNFDNDILKNIAKIQHLCWNYRKVTFLFVLSKTEIRIYNCSKRPFNYENTGLKLSAELEKLEIIRSEYDNIKTLEIIKQLFSRIAVDSGSLWNTDNALRDKIFLQERIDKYLVKSLLEAAKELKNLKLSDEIIHSVLMRSIFLMYLEDKGAAKETNLYKKILSGATSYLDILADKNATYSLFEKVEEQFNGNVFPLIKDEKKLITVNHLAIIKKCLFDGDLSGTPKLFNEWRLFRFDIIQIELLSEIYEHFLEEFKESQKEKAGQYYTPPSLVELILNEKLKVKGEKQWQFKVLDPACGSGIFLVESYKRLVKRWKNANPKLDIGFADLKEILINNIFGIEYDRLAIRVTAFSLYLAMLEYLNPKTLWNDKRYRFPYLIYDPNDSDLEKQGKNLLRQDSIGEVSTSAFGDIDLVVGNPPFGSKIDQPAIKNYCEEFNFGKDMVIPFLHKAVGFTSTGTIALIFNTKVLTNVESPFKNFRQWLFNDTYVEKVYNFSIFRKAPKSFGGQLFSSAVGPVSIVFYQKQAPTKINNTIEYWAPKTYLKNSLVDGVVIDGTDIKFLPRKECQNPSTQIWKIAMWGTLEDFKLIKRIEEGTSLLEVLVQRGIKNSVGFQFLYPSTVTPIVNDELSKLPYLNPESVQRFYSPKESFIKLLQGLSKDLKLTYRKYYNLSDTDTLKKINVFRRIGKNKEVYKSPHLLIKSGLSDKKLCASYLDEDCSFNDKVLGLYGGSPNFLKALSALINSKIATYYLFLISSSIGIEREEIKPNEVLQFPLILNEEIFETLSKKIDSLKNSITQNYPLKVDISEIENEINNIVFKLFNFTSNEEVLIDDFINITLSLLFEGHKSLAVKSATAAENKSYASLVSKELNTFLQSNKSIVNASYFEIKKGIPLNIVKLTFDNKSKEVVSFGSMLYNEYLTIINKYTLSSLAKNIYIQKQIKYYDGNSIYIIKPNQKRFWSRSMAINDAKELISEILKMS